MNEGWIVDGVGLRVEKRGIFGKIGKNGKKRNRGLAEKGAWSSFRVEWIYFMNKIPFLYRMIRGAIGKRFVVKHYKGGKIVITKFPNMSGIVASGKQRLRRDLFREAVVYAKWIVGDEERKKAFRKTLPWKKRRHVYQAAIRLYMRMQGDRKWLRKQLAVKEVVRSVSAAGKMVDWRCEGTFVRGVKRESARGGHASNVNGLFEKAGPWRVMWQKSEKQCREEAFMGQVDVENVDLTE